MADARSTAADERVLVLTPTTKDATLVRALFERAGIPCAMSDPGRLVAELDEGAAALVLAEEFLLQDGRDELGKWLAAQPAWSDLPVLVLARPGAESTSVARILDVAGNVTLLERPMSAATLVSAVKTALRARQKQYQIRGHLEERAHSEAHLREIDRRKDEFLAILAHELRNPLAPIRNGLHILRLNAFDAATISQVSEMMDRQVDHLVRLVDDLMEVSRISRGKVELRKQTVDLASIVRTAVEGSRSLLDGARLALKMDVLGEQLFLHADPVRLGQVLANLLNNAAKFTPPGGEVRLGARREGAEIVLSVRDTGIGIPAEMLSRVFDLFTQVDRGGSPGGLGIGLTLVKQLVEMHGGSVRASSEGTDKGSEFVVRLPALDPAALEKRPERDTGSVSALPRHRLLVVDDNRDAADSLGLLLRRLGAEVEVAYGGRSSLEALESFRPSAMLLDIGMPGMDGHEVARLVRARPEHRSVVLVALTGWGQKEDVARTRASGFDHHWIKPLDLATLKELLSTLEGSGTPSLG